MPPLRRRRLASDSTEEEEEDRRRLPCTQIVGWRSLRRRTARAITRVAFHSWGLGSVVIYPRPTKDDETNSTGGHGIAVNFDRAPAHVVRIQGRRRDIGTRCAQCSIAPVKCLHRSGAETWSVDRTCDGAAGPAWCDASLA